MTGRGSGRLIRHSSNPLVTIGLTLGTVPPTLSSTSTEPFYITVSARILSTPQLHKPITLQTHPSPLESLSNRSFHNITCATNPEKKIDVYPRGWPQYHWDPEDLGSAWSFVTIPPKGQGSYTAQLQVPRASIEAANLEKGEKYRVSLTDKCLGTRWWSYASLDDLEGIRLRTWRATADEGAEAKNEDFPESMDQMEMQRRENYGNGPAVMGEKPEMLAMVVEVGDIEFEVV